MSWDGAYLFKLRLLLAALLIPYIWVANAQIVMDSARHGRPPLHITFFKDSTFVPLDSVVVEVFKADSLINKCISDERGRAILYVPAGYYAIHVAKSGYQPKLYKKMRITSPTLIKCSLMRDSSN